MEDQEDHGVLLAHRDAQIVTREGLALIPAPASTDTFKPVPHITLVNALLETLSFRHIGVVKDEYAVSDDGMKLFGVMELEAMGDGYRFSLGLRNANDKSMRLGLVVGIRILVCDNLAFYGDFRPVLHKHSKHFDIHAALAVGIDQMQRNFQPMQQQVERWRQAQITDDQAKLTIYRAFVEDELDAPKHLAKEVHRLYFNPELPDFAPRTEWSLQNSFTRAFKQLDPIPMYRATASLGQLFLAA